MKNLFFIWLTLFGAVSIPLTVQGGVASTGDALDGPGLNWGRLGGEGYTPPPADTHDGVDAFRTTTLGNPGTNFVHATVTGPGTVTFWWKVSSEFGFDTWGFWIGPSHGFETNEELIKISGEVGWTQQTYPVPEGVQTLEWAYVKDDSGTNGADKAWLDEVFYYPDPPSITDQPLDTNVVVGETASFSIGYQTPETYTPAPAPKFFWQFNSTNLPGKTNATLTLTNLQVSQSGNYRVIITNGYGKATSEVAELTVVQPYLLEWGLDTTGLVWTAGGDTNWFAQADDATNALSHDGIDVARSGHEPEGDDDQLSFESWVQTTVTGPGTLKFWWRLTGFELGQFYLEVGGSLKTNVPPDDETWQEEIVAVPAGSKTLKWTYLRGDFISTDDDAAFLDQVRFSPATNAPPIFSLPSFTTNGFSARIELDPYRGYTIQRSTNLTAWTNIMTFTNSESIFDFLDTTATNSTAGFYRIKSP